MSIYRSFGGMVQVKLTSADLPALLAGINGLNIPAEMIQISDDLSIVFSIQRRYLQKLTAVVQRRGGKLDVLGTSGMYWMLIRFLKRPAITVGVFLVLLLGVYLPGRILLISVEGNSVVPERRILEAAEGCGVTFGTSRRQIRSERVKNEMLSCLPQLQWAGVNTYGCRAVITVRERSNLKSIHPESPVSSIVAVCDGVINTVTVTKGTGLCQQGQAVQQGQVLISGYTDWGDLVSACRAQGEVTAVTRRDLQVCTPLLHQLRRFCDRSEVKYSLQIGKKRINFYKGSGISGGTCVKMYQRNVLTLPGGFELPVALIRETTGDAVVHEEPIHETANAQLSEFASRYLKSQMIAGTIQHREERFDSSTGVLCLYGRYACTEMIGRQQDEMIGEYHGKNDGTDRERRSGG